ncbi:hypothetical protein [Macellibacteroides fermentans]|uniref:hypothetical protein n=1 Tax=Macellibacteroides fermentans TaxID=879969 RepID=UPI00406C9D32
MKYLSLGICLSLLLLLSCCAVNDKGVDNAEDQTNDTIPVESENQLLPLHEQPYDAEFDNVYKTFTDAVRNKDLSVIDGFLDDDIMVSFGSDPGKAAFYEYWNLNNKPEQSELWTELEEIIALGGHYNRDERTFTAPYTYADFPDDMDSFVSVVVIDEGVNVYEKKEPGSEVIAQLNYNIIKLDLDDKESEYKPDEDLIKIETPSGKKGYVQKQFVRSPIDYRLSLIFNKNSEWKLVTMISGD